MKPIYKISIIITCLVSLFFFSKWLWKVWPRYEWEEDIVIIPNENSSNLWDIESLRYNSEFCKILNYDFFTKKEITEKEYNKLSDKEKEYWKENGKIFYTYIDTNDFFKYKEKKNVNIEVCYKKEKVRIN